LVLKPKPAETNMSILPLLAGMIIIVMLAGVLVI
jgi:hypothetical protein